MLQSRISQKLRASTSLFFYRGDNILAAAHGAPEQDAPASARVSADAIVSALASESGADTEAEEGESPNAPQRIAEDRGLAVFSPVVGSAAHAGVGFAVASMMEETPDALSMVTEAPSEDVEKLPVELLAGAAALVVFLAMLFIWLERDRPMKVFASALKALASRDDDRMTLSAHSSRFRNFAQDINESLDRVAGEGVKEQPSSANIDEVLGDDATDSYFGFAEISSRASIPAAPDFINAVEEKAMDEAKVADAIRAEDLKTIPPEALTALPEVAPPSIPSPEPEPEPEPEPSEEPQAEPAFGASALSDGMMDDEKTMVATASEALLAQAALGNDGDEATVVASASDVLLAQTASDDAVDPLEAHFHETYERYVAARAECGESTEGITFERFRRTLTKNREKILTSHPGSEVEFTVYVKNGRAALKAKRKS